MIDLSTIANILGVGALILAGFTISRVDSAELGKYSSRFIATLLALFAYLGVTSIGGIVPELPAVKLEFLTYVVPVLAVAGMAWCAWKVYENRESEIATVLNSGWKFVLVAIFAVLGRGLLSV